MTSITELAIVPFHAGKRPLDEALQPGSGCSEHVGLVGAAAGEDGPTSDHVFLLYGLKNLDWLYMRAQPAGFEPDLDVTVSAWFLPHDGAPVVVPGLVNRSVPVQAVAPTYPELELMPASPRHFQTARYAVSIAPDADLVGPTTPDVFGFEHQFKQRVRIELAIRHDGKPLAQDTTEAAHLRHLVYCPQEDRNFYVVYRPKGGLPACTECESDFDVIGEAPEGHHALAPIVEATARCESCDEDLDPVTYEAFDIVDGGLLGN